MEATVRYAAELGYEVTIAKDATASYSDEEMHAALDIDVPKYAGAVATTNEVVDAIFSPLNLGISNVTPPAFLKRKWDSTAT